MEKWFVLHTQINDGGLMWEILRRICPEYVESVKRIHSFKRTLSFDGEHKSFEIMYPNYLFFLVDPEIIKFIHNRLKESSRKLGGFLGFIDNNYDYTCESISDEEMETCFLVESGEFGRMEFFKVGSRVTIKSGYFSGMFGDIESVNKTRDKYTVRINMFSRITSVEMNFFELTLVE